MKNFELAFKKAFSIFLAVVLANSMGGWSFADESQTGASAQTAAQQETTQQDATQQANYTVKTYVQDATGEGYTLQSAQRQGEVGTTVPTSRDLKVDEGYIVVEHESAKLEADGTTEVIVQVDRKNFHMTFNANGGVNGPDALYARFGSPIGDVAAPTRAGFVFAGWYEDAACTIPASVPETMPAQDKTYYAGWTAESEYASIDLVYWGENADDTGYSYLFTKTDQAEVGTKYSPKDKGELDKNLYTWAASDEITVDYVGNVANIYYKRTTFMWRFGDSWWYANTRWGAITAKWGADVSTQFQNICEQVYGEGKTSGEWSVVRSWSSEHTGILTHMGTENIDYYDNGKLGDYEARYYVQNIGAPDTPGATEGVVTPSNYTKAYVAFWRSTGYYTTSVDYIDITGFTLLKGPELGTYMRNGGLNFYYARNWYSVALNNGESIVSAVPVQYEQNLGETVVATYVPERPASVDSHYHFAGWCLSPDGSGPVVDLSAIGMPAANVIFYAKWVPDVYMVTFSAEGTPLAPAQSVEYGKKITTVPVAPEKSGSTFVGWFYEDATGEHAFDPANMTVTQSMNLYAKYSGSELRGWWVYYRLEGTDTDVAEPRWGEALVGRTLEIPAKTDDSLYEAYRSGYAPTVTSVTLEVSADGSNTYTFWYRCSRCTLTLEKQVNGLVAPGQAFIFRVSSVTDANLSFYVVVRGAASVTVRDVPVGAYVVSEETLWSWRYTADQAVKAIDMSTGKTDYALEFTNNYTNARWASGLASATNVRR